MIKKLWKLLFCTGILLMSCEKKHSSNLQIKITKQNSGYGYQILKKQKVIINQPYIPAIQGEKSFKYEKDAQKTADLVVVKIKKYSFPKISIHELDSMKIAY
ncbi:DUF4907 domain-containing protein [Chryseobacterium sp.]|uniref:DUF4907 domain-containing protein n=1 Tax=Chryseobacterium sp. TaxID=1871047 RepID=UPI0026325FE4|nr:DUF4907 domain-containing protein [Chryseobacterium sp.]